MTSSRDTLTALDGQAIPLSEWLVDKPRALIQISHGMAEHSERYTPIAEALNQEGIAVIAHDHRGHGRNPGEHLGHYADSGGWEKVLSDLNCVYEYGRQRFPQTPMFLLAHSMGSFIGMGFLQNYPSDYRGVVLSGSNYETPLKFKAGLPIARAERTILGPRARSRVMTYLSFGSFNQGIKDRETAFDWLSRDREQVGLYVEDPLCGFDCSTQLWVDLLGGLQDIYQSSNLRKMPDVPYYLFSGDRDPVGRYGKGLKSLQKQLLNAGKKRVALSLYAGGRHEMLNESNRDSVIRDLVDYIRQNT